MVVTLHLELSSRTDGVSSHRQACQITVPFSNPITVSVAVLHEYRGMFLTLLRTLGLLCFHAQGRYSR